MEFWSWQWLFQRFPRKRPVVERLHCDCPRDDRSLSGPPPKKQNKNNRPATPPRQPPPPRQPTLSRGNTSPQRTLPSVAASLPPPAGPVHAELCIATEAARSRQRERARLAPPLLPLLALVLSLPLLLLLLAPPPPPPPLLLPLLATLDINLFIFKHTTN